MRGVAGFLVAVGLAAGLGATPAAAAPHDGLRDAADECTSAIGTVPEVGGRTCKSIASGLELLAANCRRVPGLSPETCAAIDDRVVAETAVAAYEASATHRALVLQRGLDDDVPLLDALVPHTHNSFNAPAYAPTVSNLDPNQLYTVADQLRMDMRAIELDLHWVPGAAGDPMDVVVCHGEPVAPAIHAGCSVDRPLADFLGELRGWLEAPPNADQVLLLYLENNLDGDPAAHDAASADIESTLGDLVFTTPPDQPCAPMPLAMSRAGIRATGARVLIVGNCGPGAWGTWVHDRGPQWDESGLDHGDDYSADCEAERGAVDYPTHWVRRYEDSTWLSTMAGGGGDVTVEETARMIRCGVNMPGFDQLRPDDPRLAALVWSWAADDPAVNGGVTAACAFQGGDARFHSGGCEPPRPYACRTADGGWGVTAATGPWSGGDAACAAEFTASTFAVPPNGWQNGLLHAASAGEVWLAYAATGGDWAVGGAPVVVETAAPRAALSTARVTPYRLAPLVAV